MKRLVAIPSPSYSRGGAVVAIVAMGVCLIACAEPAPPVTQATPTPTPTLRTHALEAYVFYDEDGDLILDAAELGRVPGVDVSVGGQTGRSELRTGHLQIEAVPEGQQTALADHLPPYYVQRVAPSVNVPANEPVQVPLQLDIGSNRPNVYMAFGDSITDGTGSSDTFGYRKRLQKRLVAHFAAAAVENEGVPATRTDDGLKRIGAALGRQRPAYTLILYGTNDWNDAACKKDNGCPTVDNLTAIVRAVRAARSLPVLGTIIPANPAYPVQNPPSRNAWVDQTNRSLRLMAQSEGVLVADLHAAFMARGDLVSLFADHVHPNDAGYEVLATELLRAITGDITTTVVPVATPSPAFDTALPGIPTPLPLPLMATPDDRLGSAW
jgi:lysophospholipase L1-like esterase